MRAKEIFEGEEYKFDSEEFKALLTPSLLKLGKLYSSNGKDLRIVGGAVRDLLLSKDPKDIDLASDATPEESLEMLHGAGIRVIETGIEHGTITAVVSGEDFEITTLRIDKETDGRHAEVEFTKDWKQDAERRDLTFNAMSLEFDGTLHDYFGGWDDLKAGQSKFVGDADRRIQEDYLRILRYFRFQGRTAQPNWNPDTLDSIKRNANGLKQISGERIWMEMGKILAGNFASEILNKMLEAGVDNEIGLPQMNLAEFDRVKNISHDNEGMLLAAILDTAEQLDTLDARWKMSKNQREFIRFLIENRGIKLDQTTAKDMYLNPKIPEAWVRSLAHYQGQSNIAAELKRWQKPVFPVTGKDLIAVGVKGGPEMGSILQNMKDAWTKSGYEMTKDDLMKMVKI